MPERIWFVIPAAGASTRFGGSVPKPYLRVSGRSLLEHALRALKRCPGLAGGVVVTARGDRRWRRLPAAARRGVTTTTGGESRARSVLHGLQSLSGAAPDDWVLVHDAARPCLPPADLAALIRACRRDQVGGLLALPIAETVRLGDSDGRSRQSVPRAGLWRAQTPQMFRHGALLSALARSLEEGIEPSDEAVAIERMGLRPRLVQGSPLNIKVTRPADLAFARAALGLLKETS